MGAYGYARSDDIVENRGSSSNMGGVQASVDLN